VTFHSDPRITVLPALAGLAVTYVRNIVQYRRYSWDSWLEFGATWLVHYIAILLIIAVAYGITRGRHSLLAGRSETLRQLTLEDAIILASILVLITSAAVFVLAHWVPVEMGDQ
jgi:hypothetical protein